MRKYLQVLIGLIVGIIVVFLIGDGVTLGSVIGFSIAFFGISLIGNSDEYEGTTPFGIALIIYLVLGVLIITLGLISNFIEYWPFFAVLLGLILLFYFYAIATSKKK